MNTDGENTGALTATPINVRWLSGTLLMGLTGLALIGGSVFTAMQGEARLAIPPEGLHLRTNSSALMTVGGSNNARKADRILLANASTDIRQTLRMSSVYRTGDREVVRTRPVVRVSVSLSPVKDDKLAIPAFNPGSMFSDSGSDDNAPEVTHAPPPDTLDSIGDISYVTHNLPELTSSLQNSPELPLAQVLQRVKETATLESVLSASPHNTIVSAAHASMDMAAASPDQEHDFGFKPRRVIPNMSVVSKTTAVSQPNAGTEKNITLNQNERIEDILARLKVPHEDSRIIASTLGSASGYGTLGLQKGQTLTILMPSDPAAPQRPMRVIVRSGPDILARIALNDNQKYVTIDSSEMPEGDDFAQTQQAQRNSVSSKTTASLYESIYTTSLWQNVPKEIIGELIRIFGHNEDLQRRTSASDTLDVLYTTREDGKTDGTPEILYAALSSNDVTHRFYFFQSPDNAQGDYFDETGRSARKFLINKPVAQGIMRSGFGSRRHPILGYSRAHTGVDWAAPRGTPIFAAGDGVITKADWQGGYGRAIRVQHANSHETLYAHMSAFAPGMKEGLRVRQGQVIGYIGSTGLSTGPHLHFEIRINGRPQDPMRLRVPKQEELSGESLAQFRREKEKLDNMMGRTLNAERNPEEDRKS